MAKHTCCLTCDMFQLLLDHYPDGYDPATGTQIMPSLAQVAAFLLKGADDAFLQVFAAQVRYDRNLLLDERAPVTDHFAAYPVASQAVN